MELLKMDAQKEQVQAASPAVRYLAWAFLVMVGGAMLLMSILAVRKIQRGDLPGQERPAARATDEPGR